MRKLYLILSCITIGASCGRVATSNLNDDREERSVSEIENRYLGAGYDSVSDTITGNTCVTGKILQADKPEDPLAPSKPETSPVQPIRIDKPTPLRLLQSYEELRNEFLRITPTEFVKAVQGKEGSTPDAKFLTKTVQFNDYSIYLVAHNEVRTEGRSIQDPVLVGKHANKLFRGDGKAAFYRACGDSFVWQNNLGGKFLAVVEIKVNTQAEMQQFLEKIKTAANIADLQGELGPRMAIHPLYNGLWVGDPRTMNLAGIADTVAKFPSLVNQTPRPGPQISATIHSYDRLIEAAYTARNHRSVDPKKFLLDTTSARTQMDKISALAEQTQRLLWNLEYIRNNPASFPTPVAVTDEQVQSILGANDLAKFMALAKEDLPGRQALYLEGLRNAANRQMKSMFYFADFCRDNHHRNAKACTNLESVKTLPSTLPLPGRS